MSAPVLFAMWDEAHLAAGLLGDVPDYGAELAHLLDEPRDLGGFVEYEVAMMRRTWLERRLASDAVVRSIFAGHGPARAVCA